MLVIDEKKVMLAGDWHESYNQAAHVSMTAKYSGISTIIQLGDFGIWGGSRGKNFLDELQKMLQACSQTVYFVDGNHEEFPELYKYPLNKDGVRPIRENIIHLPRGYVFKLGSSYALALGGAYSIDRGYRTEGKDFWAAETITDKDVERAIASSRKYKIRYMFTHDSPSSAPNLIVDNVAEQERARKNIGEEHLSGAQANRELLDKVYTQVKPELIAHGHYHRHWHLKAPHGMILSLDEGKASTMRHTYTLEV